MDMKEEMAILLMDNLGAVTVKYILCTKTLLTNGYVTACGRVLL